MSNEELSAMREELNKHNYPLSPDTSPEQTIYDFILFLLFRDENSDRINEDTQSSRTRL